MKFLLLNIAVSILILENFHCLRILKLIPEVPTVTYYDKQYIDDIMFQVRRYSRKSDYVVNAAFTTKVYIGNNISLHYVFYEYLHNEYRRSFVELQFKLCDLILKDQLIGAVARKVGFNTCPMPPGRYSLMNVTFEQEFPYVFPFEKGKCELTAYMGISHQMVLKGDLSLTFKQRVI